MTRILARYFSNFNFSKSVTLQTVTDGPLVMEHSTCLPRQIHQQVRHTNSNAKQPQQAKTENHSIPSVSCSGDKLCPKPGAAFSLRDPRHPQTDVPQRRRKAPASGALTYAKMS